MKWLTLEMIKQNSRIDGSDEDKRLTSWGNAAERTVLNYLNRSYQEVIDTWGEIPEDVINASLMLVDIWYHHRSPAEPVNMSVIPYTFDMLIKPYMRLASQAGDDMMQRVTIGSDVKITFTAELPDNLKLSDIDFTGKVVNMNTGDDMDFTKADCIMTDDGASYVVMVDTETMGLGDLTMRLTVHIPDTDYPSGYRKEVIKINPYIRITG